jgi:ferritin-like metal-binding protein YciE
LQIERLQIERLQIERLQIERLQIERLEQVFELLGKPARGIPCSVR